MGQIGDQVVFPVSFIFDGLFMPLHGRFDLNNLCGYFCIGRWENICGIKVVMDVGMKHVAGFGDGSLYHFAPVVVGYQINREHINDQHNKKQGQ